MHGSNPDKIDFFDQPVEYLQQAAYEYAVWCAPSTLQGRLLGVLVAGQCATVQFPALCPLEDSSRVSTQP